MSDNIPEFDKKAVDVITPVLQEIQSLRKENRHNFCEKLETEIRSTFELNPAMMIG